MNSKGFFLKVIKSQDCVVKSSHTMSLFSALCMLGPDDCPEKVGNSC